MWLSVKALTDSAPSVMPLMLPVMAGRNFDASVMREVSSTWLKRSVCTRAVFCVSFHVEMSLPFSLAASLMDFTLLAKALVLPPESIRAVFMPVAPPMIFFRASV